MNIENFKLVLAKIESDPNCWDQSNWHCGTKHCFAGWAQILSGKEPNVHTVRTDAREFLDIDKPYADYLFDPDRTINDLKDIASGGYNCAGYDRDGYDRTGYDRAGYNRYGYNRYGYNRNRYNRDGYDSDGLDSNNKPR